MSRNGAPSHQPHAPGTAPLERAAAVVGMTFVVLGLLGFIPGLTTEYGRMRLAGPQSSARLFALFGVSVLHNLVHLAFGVLGLWAAHQAPRARGYLVGGGITYLLLWVYGLGIHRGTAWNFLGLNGPDNWLHLGIGFGMVALGGLLGGGRALRE
jgi:hypothetical protein